MVKVIKAGLNKEIDTVRKICEQYQDYYELSIGYMQFYSIDKKECEEYGYQNFQDTVFGTDQFNGETKYWGQGIERY